MTANALAKESERTRSTAPLGARATAVAPVCDAWSVRTVDSIDERIMVRQDICEPVERSHDHGTMVTVTDGGGTAHVATPRCDADGLREAFLAARAAARAVGHAMIATPTSVEPSGASRRAVHRGPDGEPLPSRLAERIDPVVAACRSLAIDPRIVDRRAWVTFTVVEQGYVDSTGTDITQQFHFAVPNLMAVASHDGVTEVRTLGGQYNGFCRQGGLDVLAAAGFLDQGSRVAAEALELAMADPCPSATMDLVLMPDQMMLQIHESIGHPLELDRILGDERNFAGTSFVTPEMFGHYRYGSDLLDVSHDPTDPAQFATFAVDDEGTPSAKVMLIERGILKQPLGGATSLARLRARPSAPPGAGDWRTVATTRACSWNRAPIDRMSNLNIEPGTSTLGQMIGATTLGILMQTNCSWSIDDSRNKFQFGCEHGRMIRDGRLAEVVRNPNYRGISATFWRSLANVGDQTTREVLGTPFCGKGEPMQVIRVGHAAPVCRFTDVAVFGGR
jgi:predicted Zn-dependent protease